MTQAENIIITESTKHGLSVKGSYETQTVAVSAWQAGARFAMANPELMRNQFLKLAQWLDDNVDYHGDFLYPIKQYLDENGIA